MDRIRLQKIGSDIEFFLQDKNTKEIVSAEGIIKGTKHEPFHFDKTNKFYATSLDNVAAEGNIPPATNAYQFYRGIQKLIKYINSTIPSNLETVAIPSARLNEKWLQTANAKEFGCAPSQCCWDERIVQPKPTGDNLRATGFHLHVSYEDPNYYDNLDIVKAMDLFLGIPSILLEPKNERKKVGYGVSGNCRATNFGIEYRSLSSYFASSKELIQWSFNNTKEAIKFINKGSLEHVIPIGKYIQETINSENKKEAKKLVKKFNIKMP